MKTKNKFTYYTWTLKAPPPGSQLWLRSAGQLVSTGTSRYHWLPDYFCPHIISAGEGIVKTGGKELFVKPGDMFTIWAGVEIEYWGNPQRPWSFYWLNLTGPQAEEYVAALGFRKERPVIKPEYPEKCLSVFQKIYSLTQKQTPENIYLLLAELYKLPAYASAESLLSSLPERDVLTEALTLINSMNNLNVNEVCELLDISRVTLFRVFRDRLKKTPIEYIRDKRLQTAVSILRDTEYAISKTAELSGFNSEKYFIRCFKQATGQTPGEFRKTHSSLQSGHSRKTRK